MTIAPISNRADWTGAIYVVDADTGEAVDVTDVDNLQIELEDPDSQCAVLTGSLTGGEVTLEDAAAGAYSFRFAASATRVLEQQRYLFAARIIMDSDTRQLFVLPIQAYDGVVA